jgi:hypothetical protein
VDLGSTFPWRRIIDLQKILHVKPTQKKVLRYALVLLLPCHWISSEVIYARGRRPAGITRAADYYDRFGAPSRIARFERSGATYYHLFGHLPRFPWVLAFPSASPAYVFDSSGRFVEWSIDPGEDLRYQNRWPIETATPVNPADFKARHAP